MFKYSNSKMNTYLERALWPIVVVHIHYDTVQLYEKILLSAIYQLIILTSSHMICIMSFKGGQGRGSLVFESGLDDRFG